MNLIELRAKQSITGEERTFIINMDNVTMITEGESTKPVEGVSYTDSFIRLWFTHDPDPATFFGVSIKTFAKKADPYLIGALAHANA